jgi:hypothetical protein
MTEEQKQDLMDEDDGENRAVRSFLSVYGSPGLTVKNMKRHMELCGWNGMWPEWVDQPDTQGHLTKGGAQSWIRYLFSLEDTRSMANILAGGASAYRVIAPDGHKSLLDNPKAAPHFVTMGYEVEMLYVIKEEHVVS